MIARADSIRRAAGPLAPADLRVLLLAVFAAWKKVHPAPLRMEACLASHNMDMKCQATYDHPPPNVKLPYTSPQLDSS